MRFCIGAVNIDLCSAQDLDRTVPLLLHKTADTNRFIRTDAHAALINVTQYVTPTKAVVAVTTEGLRYARLLS